MWYELLIAANVLVFSWFFSNFVGLVLYSDPVGLMISSSDFVGLVLYSNSISVCGWFQTLLDGNVSFEGKVNLSQPDNNFHILEYYGANQAEPSEHPYTIYFGRWVSKHVMPSIDLYAFNVSSLNMVISVLHLRSIFFLWLDIFDSCEMVCGVTQNDRIKS